MPEERNRQWPRDLKIFALIAALWAVGLTVRILARDATMYPAGPMQAVIGGMKFFGPVARAVVLAQATVFATFAIGIATERRWGLLLALCYMAEAVMSHLIFMGGYMHHISQATSVRLAALSG